MFIVALFAAALRGVVAAFVLVAVARPLLLLLGLAALNIVDIDALVAYAGAFLLFVAALIVAGCALPNRSVWAKAIRLTFLA